MQNLLVFAGLEKPGGEPAGEGEGGTLLRTTMPRAHPEGNGRQRIGTKIKAARKPPRHWSWNPGAQDKSGPRSASFDACAGTVPHPASVQVPAGGALRV